MRRGALFIDLNQLTALKYSKDAASISLLTLALARMPGFASLASRCSVLASCTLRAQVISVDPRASDGHPLRHRLRFVDDVKADYRWTSKSDDAESAHMRTACADSLSTSVPRRQQTKLSVLEDCYNMSGVVGVAR